MIKVNDQLSFAFSCFVNAHFCAELFGEVREVKLFGRGEARFVF